MRTDHRATGLLATDSDIDRTRSQATRADHNQLPIRRATYGPRAQTLPAVRVGLPSMTRGVRNHGETVTARASVPTEVAQLKSDWSPRQPTPCKTVGRRARRVPDQAVHSGD